MARILRLVRLLLTLLPAAPLLGGAAPPNTHVALSEPAPSRGWLWPLEPRPAVVRAFDPPAQPWLSGHRGIDLAGGPNQAVVAPHDGVIAFAGWVVDRPVLTVDHAGGLRSSFEPAETDLTVGTRISRGQRIGRIAAAPLHCGTTCLHWGVRQHDDYVSPLRFVADTRPSVLLPWRDP
ncbi:murein hydrolase activator EnvC family protein [Sinomonas sp.]|uniref:murein hydrolase activator EnvC family protein n=1 Tax=Sinomonas sp. TaxID=1914986 RepID=UPI002FE1233F